MKAAFACSFLLLFVSVKNEGEMSFPMAYNRLYPPRTEMRFMISLHISGTQQKRWIQICGGVMVTSRVFLTTAFCRNKYKNIQVYAMSSQARPQHPKSSDYKRVLIWGYFMNYSREAYYGYSTQMYSGVALGRLSEPPIVFNKMNRPIRLPRVEIRGDLADTFGFYVCSMQIGFGQCAVGCQIDTASASLKSKSLNYMKKGSCRIVGYDIWDDDKIVLQSVTAPLIPLSSVVNTPYMVSDDTHNGRVNLTRLRSTLAITGNVDPSLQKECGMDGKMLICGHNLYGVQIQARYDCESFPKDPLMFFLRLDVYLDWWKLHIPELRRMQ